MNRNVAPQPGEQTPDAQDDAQQVEYPTFEEHMEEIGSTPSSSNPEASDNKKEKSGIIESIKNRFNMLMNRKRWLKHNSEEMMRPSVKNRGKIEGNISFFSEADEIVYEKVTDGEKLNAGDVFGLLKASHYIDSEEKDGIMSMLEEIGISDGQDFDVRYGGWTFTDEGKTYEEPLRISFKNKDGSFTEISATKGKERSHCDYSFGRQLMICRGPQNEGYDVSYQGHSLDMPPIGTTRLVGVFEDGDFRKYKGE